MTIQLQFLGVPAWQVQGQALRPLAARDSVLLLRLAQEGPLDRRTLAALLWPDSDARRAGISLRQRIFRLKALAGSDVVVGDKLIALVPTVRHDLDTVESGLASNPDHARGELLAGVEAELALDGDGPLAAWLGTTRQRWSDRLLHALAAQADTLAAQGRVAAALAFAERLVAEQPLAEHAHRRLMRLHYLRGDRAAALAAFGRCVDVLQWQQGLTPGAETLALAHTIQGSDNALPVVAAPLPPVVRRPPQLVGRQADQAAIDAALQAGRVVLISGEPGIGKSRLLGDRAAARPGSLLLGARPGDADLPWSLVSRLVQAVDGATRAACPPWAVAELARVAPALGAAATGPLVPLRLQQAVQALLSTCVQAAAGTTGPSLDILIDDLQFADTASLHLLLAQTLPTGMVARWTLAVRAGEWPPELQQWVQQQRDDGAASLVEWRLAPLGFDGVAELLHGLALPGIDAAAWAQPLLRHTAGNPLFLLETLAAWLEARRDGAQAAATKDAAPAGAEPELPAPRQIIALVGQRHARLPRGAQRLAQLASVAAADFSVALAASVLGVHAVDLAADWQALQDALFVDERGFLHDLLREGVLATVPHPIRRELHGQIATAGKHLAPARRAQHAWAGGHWLLALQGFEQAAAAASAQGLGAEQLRLLDRAVACAQQLGDAEHLLELQLQAAQAAPVVESAQAAAARLKALFAVAATPHQRARMWLAEARRLGHVPDYPGLLAAATQALAALQADEFWLAPLTAPKARHELHFEATALLAAGLVQTGQRDAALQHLRPLAASADTHPDPRAQFDFWSMYGFVLEAACRRREAAVAYEQATRLGALLGGGGEVAITCANLAGICGHLGDMKAGLHWAQTGLDWAIKAGSEGSVQGEMSRMNLGVMLLRLGRYEEALQHLDTTLRGFRGLNATAWIDAAVHHQAQAWLLLGQTARAVQVLNSQPLAAASQSWRRAVLASRLDLLAGRPALPGLQSALAALDPAAPDIRRLGVQLAIVQAHSLPEPEAAAALAAEVAEEAGRLEYDAAVHHARLRQATLLARLGRHPEALALAREQAAALTQGRTPFDMSVAEAWWLLGQAFAACDSAGEAKVAWRQGAAWLQVSLAQVPTAMQEAYLTRQVVNRALWAAAAAA